MKTTNLFIRAMVINLLVLGSLPAIQAVDQERPAGEQLVRRLEVMLEKMQSTGYQARTEMEEKSRSYHCDCSGLVCYLLRSDFPIAYDQLDGIESPWRARPFSVTFYETFIRAEEKRVPGWERIYKLMDARPGDVLSWRKKTIKKGVSTGHTLVIASTPVMGKDKRVKVRVIDSTRKIHAKDSRAAGSDGVGAGVMWFELNEKGEAIRFYINESSQRSGKMRIAIGRLTESSRR